MTIMDLSNKIKQKAVSLGFDLVGITDASAIDRKDAQMLKNWLDSSHNGQMHYMARNFEKRFDPSKLLKNAKSVIATALNFKPPEYEKSETDNRPAGKIANYAQFEDYHKFIKDRLHQLAEYANDIAQTDARYKICVDSVPLAERSIAARAGLGFIAKNHMLTNPKLGSQLLLGEIITELKLKPDQPLNLTCKECCRCTQACPTGALTPDGQFIAKKCISYLTIELKEDIRSEYESKITDHLFGCDLCVTSCPYNSNTPSCKNKDFRFYPENAELELNKIIQMTAEDFKNQYSDTSLERAGLEKLKSTAHVCLKNITQQKSRNSS